MKTKIFFTCTRMATEKQTRNKAKAKEKEKDKRIRENF
jgi:hypothetical protein